METAGWRESWSWHGNWELDGLIGVSLDITHLHGAGLPQCKPTQVSFLRRRRETE